MELFAFFDVCAVWVVCLYSSDVFKTFAVLNLSFWFMEELEPGLYAYELLTTLWPLNFMLWIMFGIIFWQTVLSCCGSFPRCNRIEFSILRRFFCCSKPAVSCLCWPICPLTCNHIRTAPLSNVGLYTRSWPAARRARQRQRQWSIEVVAQFLFENLLSLPHWWQIWRFGRKHWRPIRAF